MIKHLVREKQFLFSFLFLVILLLASIANTIFNDGQIRQVTALYENGNLIGAPPFPPSTHLLLGTDIHGYDLLHVIIQGAKFTIGLSACIAMLQVGFAIVFGVGIGTFLKSWSSKIESFFDSFTIMPLTIIAYFLLVNVMSMPIDGFQQPFYQRALFEMFILTILALPTASFYVANEVKKLFTTEFVEAASVLGGSKFHMLSIHPWIALVPIVFFSLTVVAANLMLVGLQNAFEKSSLNASKVQEVEQEIVEEKQTFNF
ncbi:peptide ABC transporter permease [Bacillus pseudomycoides]|nr:peptide ABC transporter permease [Bacillus pseudomycoides]